MSEPRYSMLEYIADSLLALHVLWCGSPINPTHPGHNRACRIAAERFTDAVRPPDGELREHLPSPAVRPGVSGRSGGWGGTAG